ncbi:MAG: hypothetical protein AAGK78_00585 [Planctomycetota bacterium]
MTEAEQPNDEPSASNASEATSKATPVKYVRRDDLLAEAGMRPRSDYVLALAALSMLVGALLMTCSPLTMAGMLRAETSVLGQSAVTQLDLIVIAILFLYGLWAVVAGTMVGYRIELGRKALLAWSVAWIGYVVGAAILRITIGGFEQREMRISELACFLGFSFGLLLLLTAVPIANLRHLVRKDVKSTFGTFAEARKPRVSQGEPVAGHFPVDSRE